MQDVKNLWICDIVSPWNEDNPLIWIKLYMPKVICLWYDQVSFTQWLKDYIKKEKLDIHVKRIKAYKKDEFKSSLIKEIRDNDED
jgi:glycerol-3-phosphate cytidylyltransferase-like family protein